MTDASFRWTSGYVTDVGKVREINEDACLDLSPRGLWVVADGMGGHDAGDVASQMIVDSLQHVDSHEKPSEFLDEVEDRLLDVNGRLYARSLQGEEPTTIGSTVVAVLAFKRHVLSLWAGDSRVYRLRDGKFQQITRDHSQVEELIEQGVIEREMADDHPSANVITRAVGGAEDLFIDLELSELKDKDRYLLCSDGLYKDVSSAEMAEIVAGGDCNEAAHALVDKALERNCNDNVTVIVVQFEETTE